MWKEARGIRRREITPLSIEEQIRRKRVWLKIRMIEELSAYYGRAPTEAEIHNVMCAIPVHGNGLERWNENVQH